MNKKHIIAVVLATVFALVIILAYQSVKVDEADIIRRMEEVRGLKLLHDVPHEFVSPEEIGEQVGGGVDEQVELMLRALFMARENESVEKASIEHKAEHVVAYYNPWDKVFVISESKAFLLRKILPHEYVHVLQDQHFNLTRLLSRRTFDELMAARALIEGDACVATDLYEGKEPSIEAAALGRSLPAKSLLEKTLDAFMAFPYVEGKIFVSRLYAEGGWDAVNAALLDPPTTTEQIIHPDKYFSREPRKSVMNVRLPLGDDWKLSSDVLGEFFIRTMLELHIDKEAAKQAAAGWGGDAFDFYANTSTYFFVLNITWDSVADRDEFFAAYNDMLASVGGEPLLNSSEVAMWAVGAKYVWVRKSEESTIILSSPCSDLLDAYINATGLHGLEALSLGEIIYIGSMKTPVRLA
ncbi:MAG: hypothetical protein DRN91_03005 [Candidatus Alkanophagales archaeon]|nr:MAG: hypothetical protein DRN91_03005 [Candidatus Alkanophagales archaeon]